jgi:hypothetical protein
MRRSTVPRTVFALSLYNIYRLQAKLNPEVHAAELQEGSSKSEVTTAELPEACRMFLLSIIY